MTNKMSDKEKLEQINKLSDSMSIKELSTLYHVSEKTIREILGCGNNHWSDK